MDQWSQQSSVGMKELLINSDKLNFVLHGIIIFSSYVIYTSGIQLLGLKQTYSALYWTRELCNYKVTSRRKKCHINRVEQHANKIERC